MCPPGIDNAISSLTVSRHRCLREDGAAVGVLRRCHFLQHPEPTRAGDANRSRPLIPEREPGENVYQYIRRAAQELRESRQPRLDEQCQRIAEKAQRHDDSQKAKQASKAE